MAYKIIPYSAGEEVETPVVADKPSVEDRLARLEEMITSNTKTGGKFDGLL